MLQVESIVNITMWEVTRERDGFEAGKWTASLDRWLYVITAMAFELLLIGPEQQRADLETAYAHVVKTLEYRGPLALSWSARLENARRVNEIVFRSNAAHAKEVPDFLEECGRESSSGDREYWLTRRLYEAYHGLLSHDLDDSVQQAFYDAMARSEPLVDAAYVAE